MIHELPCALARQPTAHPSTQLNPLTAAPAHLQEAFRLSEQAEALEDEARTLQQQALGIAEQAVEPEHRRCV